MSKTTRHVTFGHHMFVLTLCVNQLLLNPSLVM